MTALLGLDRHGVLALAIALLLVALAVNAWAPARRRRLRAGVVLFVLVFALAVTEWALQRTRLDGARSWAEHVRLVFELSAAFAWVRLAALAIFDVALPALGIPLVAIAGDALVGCAYAFAGLGVLKAEGVGLASVLTTSAIVSGVVALSLQTTLGNVLGGFALQIDGSIRVGDWLQLPDGQQGRVLAMHWRHTVLESRNWDTIIVPNASLLAQSIVILGRRAGKPVQHRMWVYFNVDFRFSPGRVIDVVREALWASPIEGVAADPRPSVICYDFARDGRDSFGYYAARYWLTDLANDDPTSSRVRTVIHSALRRADIPLARPSRTLFIEAQDDDASRAIRHKAKRLRALEHVEIFDSLTPEEREYLAARLRDAQFAAGETVTRQGAVAHWLYVLCEGTVKIRRRSAEDPSLATTVATIHAPGFFGEMGMLAGEPRRADVIAMTEVECYRLDKEGLEHILRERPEIAASMSKTLALREMQLGDIVQGLDGAAHRAHVASAEVRILEKIQTFFGLERTTLV
jgi:small-conductance mechanosensitive channel/CRP-like cAMP-binding protein